MPIRKSVDDLPAAQKIGRPPSRNAFVVQAVADKWHQRGGDRVYLPAIPGRRYRASNSAFRCDRALYYATIGAERTDPDTIADTWRMALGTMIHESMAEILTKLGDGWRPEVIVDLQTIGIDGSGHADLVQFRCVHCDEPITMLEVVDSDSTGWQQFACRCSAECDASEPFEIVRTAAGEHSWSPAHERAEVCVELKSINGWGFKTKATTQGGPPEGPSWSHVVQGALNAAALSCNQVVVAYLSMELVSPSLAKAYCDTELGRFAAEWHFTIDGQLRDVVANEVARVNRLFRAVDAEVLPSRELHDGDIPAGAQIANPSTGAWVVTNSNGTIQQAGSTWFCNYCGWRQACVAAGAEATSVEVRL